MSIDQAERVARIYTGLPENVLALSHLTGTEKLGMPFEYVAECVSEDAEIDLYSLLGKPFTVEFETETSIRYINGIVSNAAHVGTRGEYALYRVVLSPWLWLLSRTSDCRIFADMSVPDIISQVFRDFGFNDFDNRLTGNYPSWNFCVQYRETAFDFVSRLMQHEGIYYYFKHENGKHQLVLCDDSSAHEAAPGYDSVPYFPVSEVSRDTEHFSQWYLERVLQPVKFATNDFSFDEPKRNLLAKAAGRSPGEYDAYEMYDYPGSYSNHDTGKLELAHGNDLAKKRLQALTATHETASASGDVRGVGAGHVFELTDCEREDQNREYLVTESNLHLQMDSYFSGDGGGAVELNTSIACIDAKVNFRSPITTRKPRIEGPQTAIVVGKKGEEIWTDKHGRVKRTDMASRMKAVLAGFVCRKPGLAKNGVVFTYLE